MLVLDGFKPTTTAPLLIYGRGGPLDRRRQQATVPGTPRGSRRGGPPAARGAQGHAAANGDELYAGSFTDRPKVRPLEATTYLQLFSKPTTYDTYRGSLRIVPRRLRLRVVNHVGLDNYLRGVVPVEMPVSWPEEALRAQVDRRTQLRA